MSSMQLSGLLVIDLNSLTKITRFDSQPSDIVFHTRSCMETKHWPLDKNVAPISRNITVTRDIFHRWNRQYVSLFFPTKHVITHSFIPDNRAIYTSLWSTTVETRKIVHWPDIVSSHFYFPTIGMLPGNCGSYDSFISHSILTLNSNESLDPVFIVKHIFICQAYHFYEALLNATKMSKSDHILRTQQKFITILFIYYFKNQMHRKYLNITQRNKEKNVCVFMIIVNTFGFKI